MPMRALLLPHPGCAMDPRPSHGHVLNEPQDATPILYCDALLALGQQRQNDEPIMLDYGISPGILIVDVNYG